MQVINKSSFFSFDIISFASDIKHQTFIKRGEPSSSFASTSAGCSGSFCFSFVCNSDNKSRCRLLTADQSSCIWKKEENPISPTFTPSIPLLLRSFGMTDLEIPPETATEFLIRIGLYLGALFQFTCILAIIVLPEKPTDTSGFNGKASEQSDQETWDSQSPSSNRPPAHRVRKQDKKKRR